jgi:hypothetical protein
MQRRSAIFLGIVTASLSLFAASLPSSAQNEAQWTSLLHADNLDNWDRTGDANWRMVDGIAEADMGFGHLVTRESYGDFVLRAEFWVDDPANSGIFIRCTDPAEPSPRSCYEVNIYDERPDPTYGTGAIPNHAAVGEIPKIGGQWNTYEITAQGGHIVLVLNGMTTVDIHDSTYANGPITLQYGAGTVRFRKVDIRPL